MGARSKEKIMAREKRDVPKREETCKLNPNLKAGIGGVNTTVSQTC